MTDTTTTDRLETFLKGVFKYHRATLDTNLLAIYRKALYHIPHSVLEDCHAAYITKPGEQRPPLVADFVAHWRAVRDQLEAAKQKAEAAALPVEEFDRVRARIISTTAGYLPGIGRTTKLADIDMPDFAKTIVTHTVQQFRREHPEGLEVYPMRESVELAAEYIRLAVRLYDEEIAQNYTLTPETPQ